MSFHDHPRWEALDTYDRAILPNLSRLLDGVIESAALARPASTPKPMRPGCAHGAADGQLTRLVALSRRTLIRARNSSVNQRIDIPAQRRHDAAVGRIHPSRDQSRQRHRAARLGDDPQVAEGEHIRRRDFCLAHRATPRAHPRRAGLRR